MQNGNIQAFFSTIRDAFLWAPDWIAGVALLVVAMAAALLTHILVAAALRRATGDRHPFLRTLFHETKSPTRIALVAFALAAALPSAPFEPDIAAVLAHVLSLIVIVLAGWIAHIAVEIASGIYLRRFNLETEDNLLARKHVTQVRILKRAVDTLIIVITVSAALMTFESVRQYGVSLFASAGVAGIVVGFAARPVLSNLIAGVQIAVTQPIRLDDVVIVEGEWGRIEEITSTYVVVRIWDLRRMIVPLTYFIEKPFQNWTRTSSQIIGVVFIYMDYTVPVERVRAKLEEIVKASNKWDGQVVSLQVTDAKEQTIELRALASAARSGDAWDLRCEIREKLIEFLRREYPGSLPRRRQQVVVDQGRQAAGIESDAASAAGRAEPDR